ncbi:potassium channel subfamily K member 17 isoform X3 [Lutra lutra]|uniref:potassium channel subfamily K member 17 isoform X3 n=1 Tax=Lutra lutra TaxID=9657 RepID=UPI001FD31A00|nr:potassium channel subfamily K member 17 isoform X3 [Lutra lutra]
MAPGPGLPASLDLSRPRAPAGAGDRAPECGVPGTVLLLLAYLAYLALGTGVFWALESPAARDSSERFQRDKWALLQNFTCLDGPALDSLIRGIIQAYQNGDIVLDNTTSMGRWEFMGSFFFSVSTVTTIGYGNLSPRTMAARLFCIFFALLGIPLNLVVLNRLGHLMQRGVQRCARRLGGAWQDPTKAPWLVGAGALLSGLPLFLLLPPLLFCHVEGWSYVESFYFAFITLSTVGFGDYVIGRGAICSTPQAAETTRQEDSRRLGKCQHHPPTPTGLHWNTISRQTLNAQQRRAVWSRRPKGWTPPGGIHCGTRIQCPYGSSLGWHGWP